MTKHIDPATLFAVLNMTTLHPRHVLLDMSVTTGFGAILNASLPSTKRPDIQHQKRLLLATAKLERAQHKLSS